ncbi:N-acetyltransferase [Verrucosispora sp. SN26_14.1]|nr:N-acetyltransferase [Verrucosispora sp. SN26_14.1]
MIFPYTMSRRIVLNPATAADRANFYQHVLRTGLGSSRQSGRATNADSRPHATFLVALRSSGEVLGFSALHALDPAGHIRLGVYLDTRRARLGIGSEAVNLSINYAFATLDIDKIIVQTTQVSFASFGVRPGNNSERAVLPEHVYFRGRLWDLHSFEILRQEWIEEANLDGVLLTRH